jgi:hypothetical protein
MRLFFRHVAPRFIGESSLRSGCRSRKQSNGSELHHQSELKTIGSKHTKKSAYDRMDDDAVSVGSEERATAGWRWDKDLGRGIVPSMGLGVITKTQSVVIDSEAIDIEGDGRKVSHHITHIQ